MKINYVFHFFGFWCPPRKKKPKPMTKYSRKIKIFLIGNVFSKMTKKLVRVCAMLCTKIKTSLFLNNSIFKDYF